MEFVRLSTQVEGVVVAQLGFIDYAISYVITYAIDHAIG